MRGTSVAILLGGLLLLLGVYIATVAQEIKFSITELSSQVTPPVTRIQIVEEETTKTVMSKTLEDGSTITQTYYWDGTVSDAQRIRDEWETFCSVWE